MEIIDRLIEVVEEFDRPSVSALGWLGSGDSGASLWV